MAFVKQFFERGKWVVTSYWLWRPITCSIGLRDLLLIHQVRCRLSKLPLNYGWWLMNWVRLLLLVYVVSLSQIIRSVVKLVYQIAALAADHFSAVVLRLRNMLSWEHWLLLKQNAWIWVSLCICGLIHSCARIDNSLVWSLIRWWKLRCKRLKYLLLLGWVWLRTVMQVVLGKRILLRLTQKLTLTLSSPCYEGLDAWRVLQVLTLWEWVYSLVLNLMLGLHLTH